MRVLPTALLRLLLVPFLCTILISAAAAAADASLSAGQSLNETEILVSSEGRFVLGFFTPGRSKNRYLGIWFNRIPGQSVVWVANKLRPLPPGAAGELTMSADGSLVLTDQKGTIYWSTGAATASRTPVARLLDTGNLVVFSTAGDRAGSYAWQSFDHPDNTLLPGMRVGWNLRTGESFNIFAWKSPDDPAPGAYHWGMDPRGVPQIVLMNGSVVMWRSGPWVGEKFSGIPDMKNTSTFSYGFVSTPDELYFKFDVWNKSLITRIPLNERGISQHLSWDEGNSSWRLEWASERDACERVDACGPYGLCDVTKTPLCSCLDGFRPAQPQDWQRGVTAAGCVREAPLRCGRKEVGDRFEVTPSPKLPDTTVASLNTSAGFDECRAACLGNCSCTAFSSSDGSGCINWFGDLTDISVYSSGGQDLYVRVAAGGSGSNSDSDGKDGKKVIIIVIVLTTLVVMLLSTLICLCRRRQITKKMFKELHHEKEDQRFDGSNGGKELSLFHLSTIESATNYFSFQNKLGEGGYGPVYKGMLPEGQHIAVKRLSKDSTQGLEEFKSEVQLVARLQHINLVRLLGCCIEKEEKILVYEYMQNQSLDKFIFDTNKGVQLDWAKRFHIIEGISQGLLYLHNYSRLRVIHRDLKASNILLDGEWNPKISDFGLARIFSWNEPQSNTKRIVGTYGYMPPEYAMKGFFSVKSDVFSFGVLLLEILSGKKSTSIEHFGLSQNLPGHAWGLWKEGRESTLMDPALGNTCPENEFSRCVQVALLCVQESPVDRPTMLEVVSMISNETTTLSNPNRPAFFILRHGVEQVSNFDMEIISPSNDVTFTIGEGR